MKATLTTLTPVHIGSGVTYNRNIDFIQSGNQIGIIDDEKLLDLIGIDNIHQWTSAIDNGGEALLKLINDRGFDITKIQDISRRICLLKDKNTKATQLKEQYSTAIKGPVIPGSSLKGAIKTSFLSFLTPREILSEMNPTDFYRIIRTNAGDKTIWNDTIIEEELFGVDANTKTTRFLQVGDFHFNETNTEIFEVNILNKHRDDWKFKEGNLLMECIPAKVVASSNININFNLLRQNINKEPFKWNNQNTNIITNDIPLFCKRINDFTGNLIDEELDLLEIENMNKAGENMLDIYSDVSVAFNTLLSNEFIIRVGGNSGWNFMTGGWILKEGLNLNTDEMYSLRMAIQKKDRTQTEIWPKTRKISTGGTLFGFVKVTLED